MPGLRALLRPTLPRRLFGALVLAFGLVAAALLALDYAEFKHDMATHPGVQTLADHLGATLADTDEPRDAALVTQASAQMLNRMRRESGQLPGTVEFQLQDANGQTVFATPGATTVRPGTHWTAEARRGPWRLVIAEPRVSDTTVLGWFGRELAGYLLLAFPLVLLPLWIAVRRACSPCNN